MAGDNIKTKMQAGPSDLSCLIACAGGSGPLSELPGHGKGDLERAWPGWLHKRQPIQRHLSHPWIHSSDRNPRAADRNHGGLVTMIKGPLPGAKTPSFPFEAGSKKARSVGHACVLTLFQPYPAWSLVNEQRQKGRRQEASRRSSHGLGDFKGPFRRMGACPTSAASI